jgi:hypothetical protein
VATDWTGGLQWYEEAHAHAEEIAETQGIGLEHAAAVLSLLSPGCPWERNIADAYGLTAFGTDYVGSVATYRSQAYKALSVLQGGTAPSAAFNPNTAPKTYAFYRNILDPADPLPVTIDRHAARVALSGLWEPMSLVESQRILQHRGRYEGIAQAYREVGAQHGLFANQIQAVVWLTFRRHFAYKRGGSFQAAFVID